MNLVFCKMTDIIEQNNFFRADFSCQSLVLFLTTLRPDLVNVRARSDKINHFVYKITESLTAPLQGPGITKLTIVCTVYLELRSDLL